MTIHTERALDSTEARAFVVRMHARRDAGFDDDVFFFFAVGIAASVLAVLFAAVFAAVALSGIGCANARQVLGYEQEAKPNLTGFSLWQCGQVRV
jgi:hypothetical protein